MSERIPYSLSEHGLYIVTHTDAVFDISEGVDDTGFTVDFDNDAITFEESAKGFTQFHRRKISKGNIVVTLDWGAIGNRYLSQAFEDQNNGNYLKNCFVRRVNNSENVLVYSGIGQVFIRKPATSGLGAAGAARAWTIDIGKLVLEERADIPA